MTVSEVVPGVWRAGTRYVNWYVVDAGGDGLTVVDAGLPGYVEQLHGALADLGRSMADVDALVLTHGHVDHIGVAQRAAAAGASVHLHPADAPLARDPRRNRSDRGLLPYLLWPATAAFVAHCIANGALRPPPFPSFEPLEEGVAVAIPGAPRVVHTPGHTDGSCVLEFRDHGVAFVGDLLCTVSPVTGRRAPPQLQTRASNADSDAAMRSLERLDAVRVRTVLPGHGRPWTDGIEAAVESARRIGCR